MAPPTPEETRARAEITRALVEHGHFIETGVPGLYGHSGEFERILRGIGRMVSGHALADGAREVCFPPVLSRQMLQESGYLEGFPDLVGSIHGFRGSDKDHQALLSTVAEGGDWTTHLCATAMTLAPAGCYALYPTQRGTLPEGGRVVDLTAWVFRHEPSDDPARLQMFRMHENVRLGSPDEVFHWRETWRSRAFELLQSLQLDVTMEVANDPFFGRGGRLMRVTQREQALKFEIMAPIASKAAPTAIASFNYHQDKFGKAFDIRTHAGEVAHTACFGFGLERIAVALLCQHGMQTEAWPAALKEKLL